MYSKKIIGSKGEDITTEYLKNLGYIILERNYMTRRWEIDIIAKEKDEIVFVVVKTRNLLVCGFPAEAVDINKQKHLYRCAEYYLYRNNLLSSYCRFDVIEVYLNNNIPKIVHLKNVEINCWKYVAKWKRL